MEFEQPSKPENLDSNFISFDEYKKLGGEMSLDDFMEVQRQPKNPGAGLQKIRILKIGLPSTEICCVFSQINAKFPEKDEWWLLTETYLCMGKK